MKSRSKTYFHHTRITRPFSIHKRKFDIRCYALFVSVNGNMTAYFYNEWYIRTSKEFDLKNFNKITYLTNYAA